MQNHEYSDEMKTARKNYYREWRAKHPQNIQEAKKRFWMRKAQQQSNAAEVKNRKDE